MKPKTSVYVAGDVAGRLAMVAKRPGTTKSKIVNEALDRFLDPARDQHLAATIVEGQRELSREIRHLHRELDIIAETLALWLRYFLTITPPLPAGNQEPTRLIGRQRFDVSIREIARRKPSDARYLARVVKLAAKEGSGPRSGAVSPRPPEGKPDQATDGATGGKDTDTKNSG
jgi:predicted DNA-binding protein